MKCFKVTQRISSGICQGYYMSAYCAESQEQVSLHERATQRPLASSFPCWSSFLICLLVLR